MSISVRWYNKNKRHIYTQLEDPWSLEQWLEARKSWYRMIKSVSHRVAIILDLSGSYEAPTGILHHFIAIHRTAHPRQGSIIVVGFNPIYLKLGQHLFDGAVDPNQPVKRVSSLEEALAMCQSDETPHQ